MGGRTSRLTRAVTQIWLQEKRRMDPWIVDDISCSAEQPSVVLRVSPAKTVSPSDSSVLCNAKKDSFDCSLCRSTNSKGQGEMSVGVEQASYAEEAGQLELPPTFIPF